MNKLFIASSNAHKISEINTILEQNGIYLELVCPKDFDCKEEPCENGKTFKENSEIKALFYYNLYHLPTLADDSGICIDYFNGLPGIYSARFFGDIDYKTKNDIVLKMMENTDNRAAQFVADICYADESGNVHHYEGINPGLISHVQKGTDGFGYDPIFLIEEYGMTEAELGETYKNEYSHRAVAMKKWIEDVRKEF
ncbi:MAG: RdgB/HAM1 family non-canonical purine NTP pyrophosphatase [Erysipelotrichaceae bacterium]|nr:RdgB/HAM1 family non-canonical purine NTP pyrophosphatase [Erysipelotrichaceae bacterium]